MTTKSQKNNILLAVICFAAVVVIVGVIGFFTLGKTPDTIQGEVDATQYRVSSKLPGRIAEIRVKEGDYVRKGDTLVILEVPEVVAQEQAAAAQAAAAQAISTMTDKGARQEQVQSAYQLWQQALAAYEIAQKSYTRVQNLYDEGVMSAQKRDEAFAAYKANEAQVIAAKSQYNMVKKGARSEEKQAAYSQAQAAKGATNVVKSLLKETVQIATMDGEVSEIYPKVGELVGTGSPIMNILRLNDVWGTFNVREDQLKNLTVGTTFMVHSPAFNKDLQLKVYYIKDEGSFAVWKPTKANGQYDLKTFEVRARPTGKVEGLRPGMSLVIK